MDVGINTAKHLKTICKKVGKDEKSLKQVFLDSDLGMVNELEVNNYNGKKKSHRAKFFESEKR